jgi:uncharacterized protein
VPDRDGYIPGVPCWIDTSQPDPKAAVGFYSGLFGWEFEDVMPPESEGEYYIGRLGGRSAGAVGSIPEAAPQMAMWNTYIWVDSADETASKVADAGGTTLMEPFDVMDAGRMAVIADPTGAVFCTWQAGDQIGAELVNGHGLLSLTQLNTNDIDRASAFYTELFGWRIEQVGTTETPYWGIYIGDQLNAGMMQLPPGQPAPPHWLVYFGHNDLDAASEKISAAGGTLLVPKMAVPGGEIVVAQDAQGAVFGILDGRFDE